MYVDINAAGCTNTCRHCSVDGCLPHGVFFTIGELRTIKSEWGALTIRYEPTTHPDFPEIYYSDIATEHGGWLVTNGFGLAHRYDYRFVFEKLHAMGIHTIVHTLHGLQAHHDWFVCREGAFDDILLSTRRAKGMGFSIIWQIFVDRVGIKDVSGLIELATNECGEPPSLSLPYHRVGGRLWHYEKIRLTLKDIEKHHLHKIIDNPGKNSFSDPASLTSHAWLEKWIKFPDSDEFKHPFEPRFWPSKASYEGLSIRIERDRKVYFDPICSSPIFLGKITDGKDVIIERLENLQKPLYVDLMPSEVRLSPDEQEQLHPAGYSLRYKEISKIHFLKSAT